MKEDNQKFNDFTEDNGEKRSGIFKKDKKFEKLKAEIAELTADLQRTRADFENYRKNTEIRVENSKTLGEKKAILSFLPIIDDIERAISHLPAELSENPWAQNVVKMTKSVEKSLSKNGIKKINSQKGELFDPEIHHAIQIDEDSDGENEIILEQLQAGYKIRDEVLRHAMVKVGRE